MNRKITSKPSTRKPSASTHPAFALLLVGMLLLASAAASLIMPAQAYVTQGGKVEIDDCDTAWTASASVTASADDTDKKEGTASAKFVIVDAFGTGLIAYHDFASINLGNKATVQLWIKSSVAEASGDLQLLLDNTAACASPEETINIPALTAGEWTHVQFSLATPASDTAIVSVGLKATDDPGARTIHLDIVEGFAHTRSYWRVNTGSGISATDSGGCGNTGTLYNTIASNWVAGKYGYGLDFDGSNDYVRTGSSSFTMPRGTYEAWVNFDNWASGSTEVLFSTPSEAAAACADMVGYWRGDELDDGNEVTDISGNGNTGTIYGTGGTATSGTATTLTDTNKSWTVNKWATETIYINGGTGSGQERTVASNTATVITVTVNWTTNPDATSEYAITLGTDLLATGRFGYALGFDGAEGYIDCGNDSSLNITDAITIEAWVKPNGVNEDGYIIAKTGTGASNSGYSLYWDGSNNNIEFLGVVNDNRDSSAVFTDNNVWVHAVISFDGTTIRFYRNGVAAGTQTDTIPTTVANVFIGNREDGAGSGNPYDNAVTWFNGTIDEVRIYNRALSEDEIRSQYLGGLSAHKNAGNDLVLRCGPATMTTSVSGLTGWHHVAATYDNTPGKAYIYLDGVQKAEASFSGGTRRIFGDYAYFGNDVYDQMQFDGKLDEVRILDYARTGFSGGVVVNEVNWTDDNEWVELYNTCNTTVNIQGWVFKDKDGNTIKSYVGDSATDITSGNYLTFDVASGSLDATDSVSVYDLDPDNNNAGNNAASYTNMVGFVAWGTSCPSTCDAQDDEAVKAGIWTEDDYIDTTGGPASVGRSPNGNRDEGKTDWTGWSTATKNAGNFIAMSSYSDSGYSVACEEFDSSKQRAYMQGTAFAASTNYHVAYFDAASPGVKQCDDGKSSDAGGTLQSEYYFPDHLDATAGSWHVQVYNDSISPSPLKYETGDANIVGADTSHTGATAFNVLENAIPEFATVLAAIVVSLLCAVSYMVMRRRVVVR